MKPLGLAEWIDMLTPNWFVLVQYTFGSPWDMLPLMIVAFLACAISAKETGACR